MITLYTRSTAHLMNSIQLPHASYTVKQFSDGELYLKIDKNITDQPIWIIASTQPPAENLLELFLLLNALKRAGAQTINIFFTYFGYARQSHPSPGEASSAGFICEILQQFSLNTILILHAHSADTLQTMLKFTNVIDTDFFCKIAQQYDALAAPDKGAAQFAQAVAKQCNKELILMHKIRPAHEQVTIESVDGVVTNKKILLVDDIIATGRTMIQATKSLQALGAADIAAAATHGIFALDAAHTLQQSGIEKIYVTNSLHTKQPSSIQVCNIGPFIQRTIKTYK